MERKVYRTWMMVATMWYLMVPPPVRQESGALAPDPYAPLARWVRVQSFDSQSDCLQALEIRYPKPVQKLLRLEAYAEFLKYGRCVEEKELELKEGQQ